MDYSSLAPKRRKTFCAGFLLLVLASLFPSAYAVCLDPLTKKSGYKLPLKTEIRAADAIIIGRVLSERRLEEDEADHDGVSASDVTIKVLRKLKGNPPRVIVIRNENTSSRYPMSIGEEHILFISRTNQERWIDPCGNSDIMPQGDNVASAVRKRLRASK